MPCFCWSGVGFAFSCFFRSLGLLCKCLFRSLDCFYIQSLRAFRRAELFDFSFVVAEFLWYLQEGLRFQQQSLVRIRYNYKLILVEVQGVVQGGSAGGRGWCREGARVTPCAGEGGGQGVGEEGKSPRRIIGKRVLRIYSSTPLDQNLYPAIPLQYPCNTPAKHAAIPAMYFIGNMLL